MKAYFAATAAILLSACGHEEVKHAPAAESAPIAVQTVTLASAGRPDVYVATGTVHARTTGAISAKVMGYVQQVNAQVGDRVRQGQVLVTIDARDLETGVRKADAGRSELQAAIPEAESAIAAAQAQFELARATYRRIDELAQKKSVSPQELDEAAARMKSAQAALGMAQARRKQIDAKLAQIDQDRTAATIMREYAQVTAPFAGIVTARTVEPGNLASPGQPLFTIEKEGAYRLEVNIDESKLSAVRTGASAEVEIEALGKTLTAKVSEVVPAVDAASRAYIAKIDLPGAAQLRSGLFGRASFTLGQRKALLAPREAVVERGQLQSVFVVENGAAHARLITLGPAGEVLTGLTAGERIVSPVPPSLTDGARVEVR